jgi:four helix bundle protein
MDRHRYEQDFRNIKAWQRSHELSLAVCKTIDSSPLKERRELVGQAARAAISVESNIAEGSARRTDSDYRRHLYIAMGSLAELYCQLILARDLAWIGLPAFERLQSKLVESRRVLGALVACLNRAIEAQKSK